MSLRAVVEIVIHLESFRNIDLFFQGIYYTRFRIHTKKKQPLLQPKTSAPSTSSQANQNNQSSAASAS